MSKARLVITAVVVEGRSQSAVARTYGVSQSWVSRLVTRYRAEGQAAFEPRSRRPKTSPNAAPAATVELIVRLRKELAEQGLDAGPATICWHLRHHHGVRVSPATVSRYLARRGTVVPAPNNARCGCVQLPGREPDELLTDIGRKHDQPATGHRRFPPTPAILRRRRRRCSQAVSRLVPTALARTLVGPRRQHTGDEVANLRRKYSGAYRSITQQGRRTNARRPSAVQADHRPHLVLSTIARSAARCLSEAARPALVSRSPSAANCAEEA
ncbi:helix-turn-helix domain-containing protein [Actinopolymorpha sp. NPDC004070]|uniref:helix-turn-helix domain-containing protein n=1 Tax=Actinopolymorpha sp. NPDC004070 TaxID=3154548 RepID=UPI0033B8B983